MFRLSQIQTFLLFVLCNELVRAASAAKSDTRMDSEPSATSVDNRPTRTLFNIVLGCASTIVISAWRSVHPNIPPKQSYLRRIFRKLDLLICTIIAPEILPLWALKQWIAAAEVRDIYNKRDLDPQKEVTPKEPDHSFFTWTTTDTETWFSLDEIEDNNKEDWTSTHGHYLIMGGFELIELNDETGNSSIPGQRKTSSSGVDQNSVAIMDPEKAPDSSKSKGGSEGGRPIILTPEMLKKLIKAYDFRIRVTEREVDDRSRADVVSKFIFVLQTLWFVTQCIARGVQGLDITQLELTTVAFASLNVITFILWMKKPLGAQVAMRVYFQGRLTEEERNAGRDSAKESFRSRLPGYIKEYFPKGWKILHFNRRPFTFLARLIVLPLVVLAFVFSLVIIIISAISLTFYDVVFTTSSFPVDASHVPPYYTPSPKSSWYYAIILPLLCIIVGGIHCAGWNLTFPTNTQRDLWHAASLAVTAIPFLSFLILSVLKYVLKSQLGSSEKFPRTLLNVIFVISVVAYVAARVFLVAQALALLRNQPPSAFLAVDWTKFVPHA